MEQYHRCMIEKNIRSLVAQSNLRLVCDSLHRKGVFNDRMVVPFKNESVPECDRLENLFKYLQTRGPNAFSTLVQTLNETGHSHLAKLLDPYNNPSPEDLVEQGPRRTHPISLPAYMRNAVPNIEEKIHEMGKNFPEADINLSVTPDVIRVKMATTRLDVSSTPNLHVYPMGSHPKGYFLLINNLEFVNNIHERRKGAEVDEQNLLSLFAQLGYRTQNYQNEDYAGMMQKIREFVQIINSVDISSIVVCIMSHGKEGAGGTYIVAHDGLLVAIEDVLELFTSRNCPGMIDKPKIFIFQTCRGEKEDKAFRAITRRIGTTSHDGVPSVQIPFMKNTGHMFVAHSTLPGYISMRDTQMGTWFIQKVCHVFMDHACNTSLEDMFKMVNRMMNRLITENELVQTSCYENRGFDKFFFNPGLFDSPPSSLDAHIPWHQLVARSASSPRSIPSSQESVPQAEPDSSDESSPTMMELDGHRS